MSRINYSLGMYKIRMSAIIPIDSKCILKDLVQSHHSLAFNIYDSQIMTYGF